MSNLSTRLQMACSHFGIRLELGFTISLDNGVQIHSVARLPDLGAPKGMLIFTSIKEASQFGHQPISAKYGYSVLGNETDTFDPESWREVFIDWGWSGNPALKPKWMTEPPLVDLADILEKNVDDNEKEDAIQKIAAIHWEDEKAQQILFKFANAWKSNNDALYSTCIDSLADIWIKRGEINKEMYDKLNNEDLTQILSHWFREL